MDEANRGDARCRGEEAIGAGSSASHRVLEKAGYVREGAMRRSAIKDGRLLDQLLYAAYDDRWPVSGVTNGPGRR